MSSTPTRAPYHGDIPHGVVDVLEGFIGLTALQCGFTTIEYPCLPMLTNLLLSFFESLASKSLTYAESAGRTKLVLNDLVLATTDFGFNLNSFLEKPLRNQGHVFKEPPSVGDPSCKGITCKSILGPGGVIIIPRALTLRVDPTVGISGRGVAVSSTSCSIPTTKPGASATSANSKQPPKAPSHLFLPSLPEPHTYIATKVTRPPPANNLAALRRRVIDQKRQVQLSLTRFISHIQPVHHLFPGDLDSFPIILPPKSSQAYLSALLADMTADFQEGEVEPMIGVDHVSDQTPKKPTPHLQSTNIEDQINANNYYLHKPQFPSAELDSTGFV